MARTLSLTPTELAPFEVGACLLSILAFPSSDETEACTQAAEALCAAVIFNTIAVERQRAPACQATYPAYSALGEREIRRRLRTLPRRLRDRAVAARIALGFLQEGISGQPAKLPPTMARLSLNELSKLVQSQSGESDPENVERRAWHDSRPIIHLATAIQIAARARGHPDEVAYGYDLHDSDQHTAVIQLAELHEKIALQDERFGSPDEALIRIRLVPGATGQGF